MRRLLVLFTLAYLPACAGPVVKTTAPKASTAAPMIYDRAEFKALVIGKTEAEVLAAVGKPDSTNEGGEKFWTYWQRTKDPVTGKTDNSILVFFRDGKVDRVAF